LERSAVALTKTSLDAWEYGHYFAFVARRDKNVTVRCKLCPGQKHLSTSVNSTSNLSKHLERQHGSTKLVSKNIRGEREDGTVTAPTPKQPRLNFQQPQVTTKAELNRLVASFIVEDMLPISTVESPSFRNILRRIPGSGSERLPSDSKTFANYLDQCYEKMETQLKQTFERLEFVSTTADIWTTCNKSFLGMTCHWIDPDNFQREKAAIACKRIKGRHTYDVVASEIEQGHSSYGLAHKVTATVTDNGSNFVKAFKMSECQATAFDGEEEEMDDGDQEPVFTDMEDVLCSGDDTEGQFSLPPHFRCASHTLNLISTNDVNKWFTANSESKAMYRSATAKCSALWTKASALLWNSFHDALSRIIALPLHTLNSLCSRLEIKAFTEKEYQFLREYCAVMKPITVALDILQGEDHCYYGALLPTLESLMSRTVALKPGLSRMTAGLADAIAIKTRFGSVMDSKEALLAACTLPKFKLRWLKEENRREVLRTLLTADVSDFFDFGEEDDVTPYDSETEVIDFLKSGSEMEVLNRFPTIKTLFMRYNTAIPSSAPVERLFSRGSLVLSPRRNRLSDKRFERVLLMRYNHFFDKCVN
uniref:BED-type domain-containing protein n=1 Tax=Salarias fasciatus TaxID=181472 RepID=A0A672FLL1_SALFA